MMIDRSTNKRQYQIVVVELSLRDGLLGARGQFELEGLNGRERALGDSLKRK